jgi:hypothetical protein
MNVLMKYWIVIATLGAALIAIGIVSNSDTLQVLTGVTGMFTLGLAIGCWWCRNDPVTNPDQV